MQKRSNQVSTENTFEPMILGLNVVTTDHNDGAGPGQFGNVSVLRNPTTKLQTVVSESTMASGAGGVEGSKIPVGSGSKSTRDHPQGSIPPPKLKKLPIRTPTNISLPAKPINPSSPMLLKTPLFKYLRTSKSESDLFLLTNNVPHMEEQDSEPIYHSYSTVIARRSRSLADIYAATSSNAIYAIPVPQEYLEFAPVYSYACTDRVVKFRKLPKSASQSSLSKELGSTAAYHVLPPPGHRPSNNVAMGTSSPVTSPGIHDYAEIALSSSTFSHVECNPIHGKLEICNRAGPASINLEEGRMKPSRQRNLVKSQASNIQDAFSSPLAVSLQKKVETHSPPAYTQQSVLELSTESGYVNDEDVPKISILHARVHVEEDNCNRTTRMPYRLVASKESLTSDRADTPELDLAVSEHSYTPLLELTRDDSEDFLYDLPVINPSSLEREDTIGDYDHLHIIGPDYDTIEP